MKLNRKKIAILSVLLLLILLNSCITTREIPERKNFEDTLVVAPVVVIDGRFPAFTHKIIYHVKLVNADNGKVESMLLTTDYLGYAYFKGIPAGTYDVKEYTTVGMYNNDPREISLNQQLVVEEGTISIFPGKLVIYIYNHPDKEASSYIHPTFHSMSDGQIKRILNQLRTHENFPSWDL